MPNLPDSNKKWLLISYAQDLKTTYINLPNKKLHQAITKLRISAHKFPIETGRFNFRKWTQRTDPCVVMVL